MEKSHLHHCLVLIEEKFGKGKSQNWTEGTFVALSDAIHAETRILISKNTLKRLFGKLTTPNDYTPQRETRNALAGYIGFPGWEEFCVWSDKEMGVSSPIPTPVSEPAFDRSGRGRWVNKIFQAGTFIGILTLVGGFYWFWRARNMVTQAPNSGAIVFSVRQSAETVPLAGIVHYKIPKTPGDTFYLEGSPDNRVRLSPGKEEYSFMHYRPSYYWLVLKKGREVIRKIPFHARSRGWTCFYLDNGNHPISVDSASFQRGNGLFQIKKSWFAGKNLDTLGFNLAYDNFRPFGISGDSFEMDLETTVQSGPKGCPTVFVKIFGSNTHLEYRMGPDYCNPNFFLNVSEKTVLGKEKDLTFLNTPADRWNQSRIQVKDKTFRLRVNGKEVVTESYNQSVGEIYGVQIIFSGFGQFRNFHLGPVKD